MDNRDYQDIAGGGLLVLIGIATVYLSQTYTFGSLVRMGPGFFPTALGALLAILGAAIALPACRRAGSFPKLDLRAFVIVLGSIVFFAATVRPLGLVAATFLCVLFSSFAERSGTWFGRLTLAATTTALTVAIFSYALGMSMPLIGRGW